MAKGVCNSKDEGMRILVGSSTTELTLVENPTMDDKREISLKSSDSLKQENHKEQMYKVFKFDYTVSDFTNQIIFKLFFLLQAE